MEVMRDKSSLLYNAYYGSVRDVESILDDGANINFQNSYGVNALMTAIAAENYDTINLLIEKGIDTNLTNNCKITPLMMASYKGLLEVARILLKNKSDLLAKDKNQLTSLMYSCIELPLFCDIGNYGREMLGYMPIDFDNLYPSYSDQKRKRITERENDRVEIAELFLQNGVEKNAIANIKQNNGIRLDMSALDIALRNNYINNTKMLKKLSEYGVINNQPIRPLYFDFAPFLLNIFPVVYGNACQLQKAKYLKCKKTN